MPLKCDKCGAVFNFVKEGSTCGRCKKGTLRKVKIKLTIER